MVCYGVIYKLLNYWQASPGYSYPISTAKNKCTTNCQVAKRIFICPRIPINGNDNIWIKWAAIHKYT